MAKVYKWLQPGGYFVTSTICMKELPGMSQFMINRILPVAQYFGIIPFISSFSKDDLRSELRSSGFEIEHEWQPKEGAAVFIIGKKPDA